MLQNQSSSNNRPGHTSVKKRDESKYCHQCEVSGHTVRECETSDQ